MQPPQPAQEPFDDLKAREIYVFLGALSGNLHFLHTVYAPRSEGTVVDMAADVYHVLVREGLVAPGTGLVVYVYYAHYWTVRPVYVRHASCPERRFAKGGLAASLRILQSAKRSLDDGVLGVTARFEPGCVAPVQYEVFVTEGRLPPCFMSEVDDGCWLPLRQVVWSAPLP
jgi:hypothetical protein